MQLRLCILFAFVAGLAPTTVPADAGAGYHDHAALGSALRAYADAHPKLLRVETLATSRQGREIWMAELGAMEGDRAAQPAVLIVAGLEGNQLLGTEAAVAFIARALEAYGTDETVTAALDATTYYVFPRLNPDGTSFFFADPQREQIGNLTPFDDDHDGLLDEDGPEDLDGDGLVTWMRIEDAEGSFRKATADDRLMRPAKTEQGESGGWRYMVEGRDNDGDKAINEDGPGGTELNRNFPFNYAYHASPAGKHQVSEAETRALADFVVAHPNIGIVFTYSDSENLLKTPKSAEREGGRGRQLTDLHKDDAPYYGELGKIFREAVGLKKALADHRVPGAFADWMYFHRGRLSLATPGWTPAIQIALNSTEKDKKDAKEEKPETGEEEKSAENGEKEEKEPEKPEDEGAAVKEEAEFLKWLEDNDHPGFAPWRSFEHPDFPGQQCEIGGFAPFAKTVPPAPVRDAMIQAHVEFLLGLAERLPRIAISKAEARHLGSGVYDLEVEVRNTGYLPTALAHGVTSGEVVPTRVTLDLPDDHVLAGRRITRIGAIAGSGGVTSLRYTIRKPAGVDTLRIQVVSALAGAVEAEVSLGEGSP